MSAQEKIIIYFQVGLTVVMMHTSMSLRHQVAERSQSSQGSQRPGAVHRLPVLLSYTQHKQVIDTQLRQCIPWACFLVWSIGKCLIQKLLITFKVKRFRMLWHCLEVNMRASILPNLSHMNVFSINNPKNQVVQCDMFCDLQGLSGYSCTG